MSISKKPKPRIWPVEVTEFKYNVAWLSDYVPKPSSIWTDRHEWIYVTSKDDMTVDKNNTNIYFIPGEKYLDWHHGALGGIFILEKGNKRTHIEADEAADLWLEWHENEIDSVPPKTLLKQTYLSSLVSCQSVKPHTLTCFLKSTLILFLAPIIFIISNIAICIVLISAAILICYCKNTIRDEQPKQTPINIEKKI